MLCSESTSWSGGSVAERLERWTCNPEAPSSAPTAVNRELNHQTFLVPQTPTGSIFAAWHPLCMTSRSWAAVTEFKTRVLRLKPEVQILGSPEEYSSYKSRNSSSEIMFSSYERKLNANLWKAFSTELFCRRSWWFHVVLLNDLHLARKPRPRSSSARSAMPFVNQERLVFKFRNPYYYKRPDSLEIAVKGLGMH